MNAKPQRLTRTLMGLAALMLLIPAAQAQVFFSDDFEDRAADQQYISIVGENRFDTWTWFDQWFTTSDCSGDPAGGFGPFDTGDGPGNFPAENRNFFTTNDGATPYFRAGLEVPAYGGALSNMVRVYGNPFNQNESCQRTLVFKELGVPQSGDYRFSFDVAQDQFGSPLNGEVVGAFVKVLKSSDGSFATLLFSTINSSPPAATGPEDVTTAARSIDFNLPEEMVGELLQFGFYNDVTPSQGQDWSRAGAYYDNVELAAVVIGPPPTVDDGIAVPTLGGLGLGLLMALFAMVGVMTLVRRGA